MTRLRPAASLDTVRLGATVAGCASMALQLAQVLSLGELTTWRALSGLAILAMCAFMVLAYIRRCPSQLGLWLEAPLLVLAAGGLVDPLATVGLVLVVLAVQSLYGTQRGWAVRVAAGLASLPLAVALTPVSTGMLLEWQTSAVLSILPQLVLVCVVMRSVYAVMIRRDLSGARDAVLARTGNLMLSAPDVAKVHELGARAAEELVALSPGVVAVFLRRQEDHLIIFSSAGLPATTGGSVSLPLAAIEEPGRHLAHFAPGIRHWRVEELTMGRYRVLGSVRALDRDVEDAFRTMSHQVLLAEESRASADQLHHQAYHDTLTQLPNRALFFRRLTEAVDRLPAGSVALLNIDLDDFKYVNDTHGHAAGDETLLHVADILREVCGPDSCPARLGGDEFAILLTDITHVDAATAIAMEICHRVSTPTRLSGITVSIGASVGVAVSQLRLTATDLTRCADIAMYSAKAQGKNRVQIFDAASHGDIARHRMLEEHVPYAISRNELALHYQPYFDAGTGACAGVEATARWEHPTLGAVGHRELLDLFHRTGDLATLTEFVMRMSFAEFAALVPLVGMNLSLKVSVSFLMNEAATGTISTAAFRTGLSLDRLLLIVPESEHLRDASVLRQLRDLVAAGVSVSVDDFGAGAVPLAALEDLPLHQIRTGEASADQNGKRSAMVISIGRLLEVPTLVPGIDNEQQLANAAANGADLLQGNALAPAMSVGDLGRWYEMGADAETADLIERKRSGAVRR